MTELEWQPIKDLPVDWAALKDPQLEALMAVWHEQVAELEQRQNYRDFLTRLRREWAIETGILERLYTLSVGATTTLLEQGFDAALLSHGDSDRPIREVIQLIQDQYDTIQGLYQFVSGERPLGTSYLKELHQALTAHQPTYEAVDSLGNLVHRPLPRGVWKDQPNQVGNVACCPPEQVSSEVDRLLLWHAQHETIGVPPYLEAAWIHHRFTLIHPFADGNGRLSRCLGTLVFLKERWFPLVLTRAERTEYILALRDADNGNLGTLVRLFGKLQRSAIKRALSLAQDVDTQQQHRAGLIAALKNKFRQAGKIDRQERQHAITICDTLHAVSVGALNDIQPDIDSAIKEASPKFTATVRDAPRGTETAHYNRQQILDCVVKFDYFANFTTYRSWVALIVAADARMELLFSFHGIGSGDSGVFSCAGMAYTRSVNENGASTYGDVLPLSDEPFSFTYKEAPNQVAKAFRRWLDDCIVQGLAYLLEGR